MPLGGVFGRIHEYPWIVGNRRDPGPDCELDRCLAGFLDRYVAVGCR